MTPVAHIVLQKAGCGTADITAPDNRFRNICDPLG